jgi:membrane protease YdiL (CAAX protease family)
VPNLTEIRSNKTFAYVVPFVAFMLFLSLDMILSATGFKIENEYAGAWYRFHTEQWIYPLQSIVCFGILLFFWKQYEFRPIKGWSFGVAIGAIGIVLWILPAILYTPLGVKDWPSFELSFPLILDNKPIWSLLGLAERPVGFDATWFREDQPFWYACAIGMRFFRMVVVVALVEEIFWRGFLLRYLINTEKPFWKTAFGTFKAKAFWIVVALFMLAHAPEDWLGAIIFCMLANWVAIRTKSLLACVLCHAVANLLLGIYVMVTQQWGYW